VVICVDRDGNLVCYTPTSCARGIDVRMWVLDVPWMDTEANNWRVEKSARHELAGGRPVLTV
jgi:hypothetical protein